jgi:hypothetical protein
MFGLITKLFSANRASSTPRNTRRPSLQVECLEDRLVPTTLMPNGPALTINNIASGDTILLQCLQSNGNLMEVLDNGHVVNGENFNKQAFTAVNIVGSASNKVIVDDSNGMPFGPGTAISVSGGVSTLTLKGNRTVAGNESYSAGTETNVAGAVRLLAGTINVDNLTFTLHGTPTVVDELPITGKFEVTESGDALLEQGPGGSLLGTAELLNMGSGGGDTLYFSEKPNVILTAAAPNSTTTLFAATPTLENSFWVVMNAPGQTVGVLGTAAGVSTLVFADDNSQTVDVGALGPQFTGASAIQGSVGISCCGSGDSVNIAANDATVNIQGDSTTNVLIGLRLANSNYYETNVILANIVVNGAANLTVDDSGNHLNFSDVTVANGTITGNGLFGNNNVTVSFSNVPIVVVEWS